MPLGAEEQLDLFSRGIVSGDVDMLSKLLTDPDTILPAEQKTLAQKLGFRGPFLEFIGNVVTDPVVWASFLLSKRFPTSGWLSGKIPDRFIGANNEFTGISKFTRPVEHYWRGTPIPRLTGLKMLRESEVLRDGEQMLALLRRPNWDREMPLVSMLLEGQEPMGATPELRSLAKQLRGHMDSMWDKYLSKTLKITGGFEGTAITPAKAEPFPVGAGPQYLRDYLPHIPLLGEDSIIEIDPRKALRKFGLGRLRQAFEVAGESPGDIWTPDRSWRMGSNFGRYQSFMNRVGAQVFNPHLFRRIRTNEYLSGVAGQDLFVTDLNVILQKYVSSLARTYSVNAPISNYERALATVVREDGTRWTPTNEPIIVQTINMGLETAGAQLQARPIAGTNAVQQVVHPKSGSPLMLTSLRDLTRALLGQADEGEIVWGNLFSSVANKFQTTAGRLTRKQEAEVDYAMRHYRNSQKFRSLSNGIASYFYSTTLGLNPWSAMQNLLQPLLTTAPAIGLGPTMTGVRELGSRIPAYFRQFDIERRALGATSFNALHRINEAAQGAFNKVFPELAHSGIKIDPRMFDIDPRGVGSLEWSKRFKTYDDFARFMMQPFTHAEMANQATTFFGAKSAIKEAMLRGEYDRPMMPDGAPLIGDALEKWLDFEASNVVSQTQFRPGPGSRSIWQNSLPAFMRMFTSFWTRLFSFMGESTVRGAMTRAQLEQAGLLSQMTGGRNLGTVARMILYGRIAKEGASSVLGVDLSDALGITTPFAVTPTDGPLGVIPMPPAAGVIYGMVSAASNRDIKRLQPMQLPGDVTLPISRTLVPGGVGLSRMARALNQWDPDMGGFVDEDRRLMFRGNTSDLIMMMLGVPLEKQRRVRDAVERTQDLRQKMTRARRELLKSLSTGDLATADAVRAQFAEQFPELPPLDVTQKDLDTYRAHAKMPTLLRMMRSMGAQGHYLAQQYYEADPDLLMPADGSDALEWVGALAQ